MHASLLLLVLFSPSSPSTSHESLCIPPPPKIKAVTFEVPLNDNAPKGERTSIAFASSSSSADSLRASLSPEMRAEQEK